MGQCSTFSSCVRKEVSCDLSSFKDLNLQKKHTCFRFRLNPIPSCKIKYMSITYANPDLLANEQGRRKYGDLQMTKDKSRWKTVGKKWIFLNIHFHRNSSRSKTPHSHHPCSSYEANFDWCIFHGFTFH